MRKARPAGAAITMGKRGAAVITIITRKGKPAGVVTTTAKKAAAVVITITRRVRPADAAATTAKKRAAAAVITTIMKRGIIMGTAIWPMWRPSLTARI